MERRNPAEHAFVVEDAAHGVRCRQKEVFEDGDQYFGVLDEWVGHGEHMIGYPDVLSRTVPIFDEFFHGGSYEGYVMGIYMCLDCNTGFSRLKKQGSL